MSARFSSLFCSWRISGALASGGEAGMGVQTFVCNILHLILSSSNSSIYLVGGLNPSEKYESIGMISNPIYGKIKNGNQTTNQIYSIKYHVYQCIIHHQNERLILKKSDDDRRCVRSWNLFKELQWGKSRGVWAEVKLANLKETHTQSAQN